jgi:hypothetical protein
MLRGRLGVDKLYTYDNVACLTRRWVASDAIHARYKRRAYYIASTVVMERWNSFILLSPMTTQVMFPLETPLTFLHPFHASLIHQR